MRELPHTRSCFVCGESNPLGLQIRFETDGRIVRSHFKFRAEHSGFQNTIHGGLIATVLDEVMVWACAVQTRRFAYCAELNVRFVSPGRPGEKLTATGELVTNRRNKIYEARGELRNEADTLLASATAKYLPLGEAEIPAMLSDFVGNTAEIFGPE
jgi:uncharacterized protein (TIGR00369 family)